MREQAIAWHAQEWIPFWIKNLVLSMLTQETETCFPCSNYTGGASLLSLPRGIVLPLFLLWFIYSQRLTQQSSVSLHGIFCQPHSSLHKLALENEPGPSVRCRARSWKVRGLCGYLRGEANQKQIQEKEEWEQKQEKATDHSQWLTAKKVTGYFLIPKTLAFVPGAWNVQFTPEVSVAIHLHES